MLSQFNDVIAANSDNVQVITNMLKEEYIGLNLDSGEQMSYFKPMLTDKKQAANLAKSSFLSRMTHDIRTPLNTIIGLLKINELHGNDHKLIEENHFRYRNRNE